MHCPIWKYIQKLQRPKMQLWIQRRLDKLEIIKLIVLMLRNMWDQECLLMEDDLIYVQQMQRLFARKDIAEILKQSIHRKTNIICTVGLNNSVESIGKLVDCGMNIMRINCSHGDHAHHQKSIDNLRNYVSSLNRRRIVASMLDIRGPKIRTGMLEATSYEYEPDDEFEIHVIPTTEIPNHKGNKMKIYCDYLSLSKTVQVGTKLLIDDGMMEVICVGIADQHIKVRALNKAVLCERKGVLIPGAVIDLPAVSEKDKNDLKFAVQNNIDFVAASFIRRAAQVREVKRALGWEGRHIGIISKIENQEGLDNIDEIIKESDGIMVARGDLGTELPPERIFAAQKTIIRKCNLLAKPVITATQMLESMTSYPSPTRAESTDVANAILDGTDCVMLSGETAKGKYPQLAVRTMHNICKAAEESLDYERIYNDLKENSVNSLAIREIIASSAVHVAYELRSKLIIIFSETGHTTKCLAKYKPIMPIISVSSNKKLLQKECINRGVIPHYLSEEELLKPMEDLVLDIFDHFKKHQFIQTNIENGKCQIICLFGEHHHDHIDVALATTTLKIFELKI